jgi:porin
MALAIGRYSAEKIFAESARGGTVHQSIEGVLEFAYRVQVSRWAFVQPFLQHLIRPNGTGQVANATVLGVHCGVEF